MVGTFEDRLIRSAIEHHGLNHENAQGHFEARKAMILLYKRHMGGLDRYSGGDEFIFRHSEFAKKYGPATPEGQDEIIAGLKALIAVRSFMLVDKLLLDLHIQQMDPVIVTAIYGTLEPWSDQLGQWDHFHLQYTMLQEMLVRKT